MKYCNDENIFVRFMNLVSSLTMNFDLFTKYPFYTLYHLLLFHVFLQQFGRDDEKNERQKEIPSWLQAQNQKMRHYKYLPVVHCSPPVKILSWKFVLHAFLHQLIITYWNVCFRTSISLFIGVITAVKCDLPWLFNAQWIIEWGWKITSMNIFDSDYLW